ncbi:hypothetical protein PIB30_036564 [Stylosanthes scabra]|uniref:Uncharacterized protein n=1 Tax=Stylosanthes scabra TaxID=79078 RepID=A0ABU6WEE4_9FABA|nr:hypothetical protein [Stylosanthes scabra]
MEQPRGYFVELPLEDDEMENRHNQELVPKTWEVELSRKMMMNISLKRKRQNNYPILLTTKEGDEEGEQSNIKRGRIEDRNNSGSEELEAKEADQEMEATPTKAEEAGQNMPPTQP